MPADDALERARRYLAEPEPAAAKMSGIPARYEIESAIGEGGMATVHRAFDRQLGRWVAIKIPRDSLQIQPVARERFRREAMTAARAVHPNLVAVHDAGEEGGRPYLVMELVPGRPLTQLLSQAKGDRTRYLRLMEKVARAVHHLHGLGIVHRDLKPGNILVSESGEPKVADFGLAHWMEADSDLTKSGTPLGTPSYMAPEQAGGASAEITPRTDVYGLGAILFHLATGRPPHEGAGLMELLRLLTTEDAPAPRSIDPSIPADLDVIIRKAVERDPARRYASALALAEDLRRLLDGEPILARPPGPVDRLVRSAKRRRTPIAIAAGVAALAVAALLVVRSQGEATRSREALELLDKAARAVERAERSLRRPGGRISREDLAEARKAVDEALKRAPGSAPVRQVSGQAWELAGRIDLAEAEWRRAAALDPAFGPARYALGHLLGLRAFLASLGVSQKEKERRRRLALPIAEEARAEVEAALAAPGGFRNPAQERVARSLILLLQGRSGEAYRLALESTNDPALQARDGIAELHWIVGACAPPEEAEAAYSKALELRPNDPVLLLSRGTHYQVAGRQPEALRDLTLAIEIAPRFAEAWIARAGAWQELGDYAKGLADLDESLRLDPTSPTAAYGRGVMKQMMKDIAGAKADYDLAIRLDPGQAMAIINRGVCREALKDEDGAMADYDLAIATDAGRPEAWFNRGILRQRRGETAGAIADFGKVLELEPGNLQAWLRRGDLRWNSGDRAGGLADYRRALEVAPRDWPGRAALEETLRNQSEEH